MADPDLMTPERARQLLDYNPETGEIFWKSRPRSEFSHDGFWRRFNGLYAGKLAGVKTDQGYLQILIKVGRRRVQYKCHHLAWAIMHNEWPQARGVMDHINGERSDNRIVNLRVVSRAVNNRNRIGQANQTSGHPCVFWRAGKWEVRVRFGKRVGYFGRFTSRDEAIQEVHRQWEIKGAYTERHKRQAS